MPIVLVMPDQTQQTMTIREVIDATAYGQQTVFIRIAHPVTGRPMLVGGEGNTGRWTSGEPFLVQTLNRLAPAHRLLVGPTARTATTRRPLTITPDTLVTLL